ncbi:MAG: twin-arginine translocase TatA/TatE family subunit [Opitutaceae bacterium]|jgi:sec-independent protein translocase protein TatA
MASALTFFALFGGIGGGEIILVLIIVLILFGGERMPELARSLGKTLREIKKATSGVEDEIKRALAEPPPPSPYTIKPVAPEVSALPPPAASSGTTPATMTPSSTPPEPPETPPRG